MRQVSINVNVNGRILQATVPANTMLLDYLRKELKLTGTVEGCGVGVCGSCTVLMDERPVSSCLVLTANCDGREILTIEGSRDDELKRIQEAFLAHHAFQCGFCTPGMIMAVKGLLNESPTPTRREVLEYLSGNLCRCGTYQEVLAAVLELGANAAGRRHPERRKLQSCS